MSDRDRNIVQEIGEELDRMNRGETTPQRAYAKIRYDLLTRLPPHMPAAEIAELRAPVEPVPAPLVAFEMMIREAHQRLTGAVPFTFSTRHGYGYPTDSIDKVTSLLGNVLRLLKSAPVPAPRLEWNFYPDNGQYWATRAPWEIHIARDADSYGDGTKRIAPVKLEGSIYVGCESVDAAKSLAEKLNAVLSPPVGTQE